jgi:ATP-dependent RNA helicase DeaD
LHELLMEDDLDHVSVVVETLTDEFDLMQVALAAVKLAHDATTGGSEDEEDEIPQASVPSDSGPGGKGRPGGPGKGRPGGPGAGPGGQRRPPAGGAAMTRIFIGSGRTGGIRPQDLVGAITGESHITGKEIGAIQISDRFSLVEVPDAAADQVIAALSAGTIKGKKTTVRRERF